MKRALLFAAALALLAASPAAASGSTATSQGAAEATIIQPIVVTMLTNLDFGMLTSSRTASGAVTVDGTNSARYAGGTSPACLGGSSGSGGGCPGIHASRFAVRGEAGRSYVVTAPAVLIASGTLAGSAAAAPNLAIETLTVRTESRPESGPAGLLDINGQDHFSIGGTLIVPAGTSAAHYQATLSVVVTYS